ncbi:hypothetical protein Purlil1_13411 [Purpureocillium lilacinum]|uniref:Uncharacterized protein n=1 Tax=Purpureocillium lilacinum TaxID=33203 RepID=A0ABR0BE37_PURLI|nr:hypothetical protein Purlil1_13411 [Purpureocillium lilacinum]
MLFTPFILAALGGSAIAQMSMSSAGMNSGMSMDPSISMSMPTMTSASTTGATTGKPLVTSTTPGGARATSNAAHGCEMPLRGLAGGLGLAILVAAGWQD